MSCNKDDSELLFFDSFHHNTNGDTNVDVVQFPKHVCITQVRIIPLGARIPSSISKINRVVGVTNPSEFKIDFFVNNLDIGLFSTFESLGEFYYKHDECIHLDCDKKDIPTDVFILRGNYNSITLAIYGVLYNEPLQELVDELPERSLASVDCDETGSNNIPNPAIFNEHAVEDEEELPDIEDGSELLFYDTLKKSNGDKKLDLVEFPKIVCITQVRILLLAYTQEELDAIESPQLNFELFVKKMPVSDDYFTFERQDIVKYQQNYSIHLECSRKDIPTDVLIIRSHRYNSIQLAIYGSITKQNKTDSQQSTNSSGSLFSGFEEPNKSPPSPSHLEYKNYYNLRSRNVLVELLKTKDLRFCCRKCRWD